MTTQQKRILPADVYDALELSVLASAGQKIIGGPGKLTCGGPGCILAHAAFLDGVLTAPEGHDAADNDGWATLPFCGGTPVLDAVYTAFSATHPYHVYQDNDDACSYRPLTFRSYTKKLGIVRGDN